MPTQVDILTISSQIAQSLTGTDLSTVKYAAIAAVSGDNTLVAAVSGKKIRVINFFLVASGVLTSRFESGTGGTALTGQMAMALNGIISSGFCASGQFETAVNTLLNLEVSGIALTCTGWLSYAEVA